MLLLRLQLLHAPRGGGLSPSPLQFRAPQAVPPGRAPADGPAPQQLRQMREGASAPCTSPCGHAGFVAVLPSLLPGWLVASRGTACREGKLAAAPHPNLPRPTSSPVMSTGIVSMATGLWARRCGQGGKDGCRHVSEECTFNRLGILSSLPLNL